MLLMAQSQVNIFVERKSLPPKQDAISQTRDELGFQVDLCRAVRAVFQQYPAVAKVHVAVTR